MSTHTTFNFDADVKAEFKKNNNVESTDLSSVVHEMRHEYDYDTGNMKDAHEDSSAEDPAEIRAVNNENRARTIEGKAMRTTYGGKKIDPKKLKNPPNND